MKLIFLFPLFAIAKTKIHPKAVNLALETSLIFDGENTKKDLSFIDGLQNFLQKLKSYLKLREQASFRTVDLKDGVLTQFFRDFSRIIINYDNEVLKNLTDILALVMEPYYYEGTTFHKIIKDEQLKSFIKDKIMDWADTDPKILKYQMAVALMSKENTPLTEFGSYLNIFFSEKDSKRLKKYLKKFNRHENSADMHKLVKKALGFFIFHRYNKLNETAKNNLSNAIKNLRDYLINDDTSKLANPKIDFPNNKHNRTLRAKIRRSQINPLLPKNIFLHKNVELNVKTQEEKKETGLVTGKVTEDKVSTKPVKVKKWEKVPYVSVEIKLDDDKHIAVGTKEHEIDTLIIDTNHSGKKEKIKDGKTINKTLEISANEATNIETSPSNDYTKVTTIESKDSTYVDLYKHIMSINIGGVKDTENIATEHKTDITEHKIEIGHKNDDTRQPETMALLQNPKDRNNIINGFDVKTTQTAQNEILNKPADEIKDDERRMGVQVQRGLPDVDIAELNTDTEELKMKIDMNPHESATKSITEGSNSNENHGPSKKRYHDDTVDSDKEEYQNKVADGAQKITNLLDSAIALKLLGIA